MQPHPLPTIDGQDLRFAGVPGGLLQAQQFGLADGVQHGLGVAVAAVQVHRGRHHLPAAVQQGQARARGGAQPHQHLLQVVKGHINTDHGIARGGLLAQGDTQALRGGKAVGIGQLGGAGMFARQRIPGAGGGIKLVVGPLLALLQPAVFTQKMKTADAAAIGLVADGLHQVDRTFRHVQALADARQAQGPPQQKVSIRVGHIDGGFQRVGPQLAQQHIQGLQPGGLVRRQRQTARADLAQRALGGDQLQADLFTQQQGVAHRALARILHQLPGGGHPPQADQQSGHQPHTGHRQGGNVHADTELLGDRQDAVHQTDFPQVDAPAMGIQFTVHRSRPRKLHAWIARAALQKSSGGGLQPFAAALCSIPHRVPCPPACRGRRLMRIALRRWRRVCLSRAPAPFARGPAHASGPPRKRYRKTKNRCSLR